MNDRLLVGTKKGLFELRRTRGDWSIAATRFLGDPISMLLADPRDGDIVRRGGAGAFRREAAALARRWRNLAGNPGTGVPQERSRWDRACRICSAWRRAATTQPGWLWCGTIPGALFLSQDHGEIVVAEPGAVGPAAAQGLDGRRVRRCWCRLDLRRSARRGTRHCRRIDRRRMDDARTAVRTGVLVRRYVRRVLSAAARSRAGSAGHPSPGAMPGRAGHDVGAAS